MYSEHHRKQKQREADRRYRLRHPDRCRERDRKWRAANPEKRKAQKRRNYLRHRAEILEAKRRCYIERNIWGKRRALYMADPDAYAKHRATMRIERAKRCIAEGRLYWPRYARRIPDWATMCRVAWAASPWLPENLTPSQRSYARELAAERGKWK